MPYLLERIGLTPQAINRVMSSIEEEQASAANLSAAAFGLGAGQPPADADDEGV
jgi:hypothetical protein